MPEKKTTTTTLLQQQQQQQQAAFCGEAVIAEFESLTRDAAAVQRDTLRRILGDNATAEYLRCRGLAGRTDAASFRACVPLATHADIEPYITRIADGDTSALLTANPITSISLSSGTTQGKRKYLPFNQELVKSTMQIYRTSYAFRNRYAHVHTCMSSHPTSSPIDDAPTTSTMNAGRSPWRTARRCSSSTAAASSPPRAG